MTGGLTAVVLQIKSETGILLPADGLKKTIQRGVIRKDTYRSAAPHEFYELVASAIQLGQVSRNQTLLSVILAVKYCASLFRL